MSKYSGLKDYSVPVSDFRSYANSGDPEPSAMPAIEGDKVSVTVPTNGKGSNTSQSVNAIVKGNPSLKTIQENNAPKKQAKPVPVELEDKKNLRNQSKQKYDKMYNQD
jgi:hypothetical protein